MTYQKLTESFVWKKLRQQAADILSRPDKHLKYLVNNRNRIIEFTLKGAGVFLDFTRQRVDTVIMERLLELAEERQLTRRFHDMAAGKKVNRSENRAALHMATRSFSDEPIWVDDVDVKSEIRTVLNHVKVFSERIYAGDIKGSTGKRFKDVVVIGIGGSYLGTEFVAQALHAYALKGIGLYFLSNVDIHNFGRIVEKIDPEATIWIVISKSYTTAETKANENQVRDFMSGHGLDPARHLITVTSKGSPGDDPANPVLDTFYMFDFIGGRYSVTSAVGGVPLSLYLGYENFERFLKGAQEMDHHVLESPAQKNLALVAALISIWNNNFLGYTTQAIIPYASPLAKLAPHIQQLSMESNGKSVTADGQFLDCPSGTIIFGEPGTNAQHSFFQLAHQGRPFPIDFIGVVTPQYSQYQSKTNGVTNHQELWANLISQSAALASGRDNDDPARSFPGNRPSSTIIIEDLSPENIGRLLSFYEAKTIFEAFVWDINPFDQFGVELGKVLAADVREKISQKNKNANDAFERTDPITRLYLQTLFSQK